MIEDTLIEDTLIDDTLIDDTLASVGHHGTREDWLTAAVVGLTPAFKAQGLTIPQVRVSCGFPSNAKRSGAIGECWSSKASNDGTVEILISPVVDKPSAVLEVLVHELVHAAGFMSHGAGFGVVCRAVGLTTVNGSWKSTTGDSTFMDRYSDLLNSLGAYPHARLNLSGQTKTQPTRMLKAVCGCGYTIRLTQKWADKGLPTCPCGDEFVLASGKEA